MSEVLLKSLLRDGARFAPLYEPVSNSDHLPMALAAMHGLGADDEALLKFRNAYATRLQPWGPVSPVNDWRMCVGDREAYPALLDCFLLKLEQQGTAKVLNEVLSTTLPGVALDAFHPSIRLGFGIEFATPEEIAAGLAYTVSAHRDMPVDLSPVDLREKINQQVEQGAIAIEASRFTASLEELVAIARYPVGRAMNLAEIASVALDIYLATRNFFALHLVTSTQALRSITGSPGITAEVQSLAVASMTGALLAAHLVLQSPPVGAPLPVPARLDPEHAIKYAWSCLSEYRVYGDGRYIDEIQAFREAGLVPGWAARDLLDQAN